MVKGYLCTGIRLESSKNYHVDVRRGRMYLCGCSPGIRVNGKLYHCGFKRHRRSRVTNWVNPGLNLWFSNQRTLK